MRKNKYPFRTMQKYNHSYFRQNSVFNVFYFIKSVEQSIELGNTSPNYPFIVKKFCDNKNKLNLFINFFNKQIYDYLREDKDHYRASDSNPLFGDVDYNFSFIAQETLAELIHFLVQIIVKIQNIELLKLNLDLKQKTIHKKFTFQYLISFVGFIIQMMATLFSDPCIWGIIGNY